MNLTTNLGLRKPEYINSADIEDFNYNSDKIDTFKGEFDSHLADNAKHRYDILSFGAHSITEPGYETFDSLFAINNAITAARTNGIMKIYIPYGRYKISDSIVQSLTDGYDFVEIEAEDGTELYYPDILNKPAIKISVASSGKLIQRRISGLMFNGSTTSTGIELAGVDGLKIKDCKFHNNLCGVLFHNEVVGTWTEYDVVEDCDFTEVCNKAIEYKITSGNVSFNGSGLKNCTINQSATETYPKILVGANCFPYNAPMDFQIWTQCTTPIIKNQGKAISSWYGNIRVECFQAAQMEIADSTANSVYFVGNVMSVTQYASLGKLKLLERSQQNSDGSIVHFRKPWTEYYNLTTGANNTVYCDNGIDLIVHVLVYATNYEYSYTLNLYHARLDANNSVNTISTNRSFNTAGYGAPTFSMSSGTLVITNASFPANGVSVEITAMQLGVRTPYQLK